MPKIENGTVTISAAYEIKVPGDADFSSQGVRLGTEMSWPVNGEYDAIVDDADVREALLVTQLKLACFAALGLEVVEGEDGTIQPDWSQLPTRSTSGGGYKGGGGGGYKGKPRGGGGSAAGGGGKAAAAGVSIPTVTIEIDEQSIDVQDLRDLKRKGVYQSTAPDFRIGDNAYWLVDKQGNVNPKAEALRNALDSATKPFAPASSW